MQFTSALGTALLASAVTARTASVAIVADIANKLGANITGTISFSQEKEGDETAISVKLTGLPPNSTHGWHVHAKPVVGRNCSTAGLHFNPKNVTHGAPTAAIRHFGDLGNMNADANGSVDLQVTDKLITLFGQFNVSGLGLVVHEKVDDLGLTSNPLSLIVGNAGSRLACANIVVAADQTYPTQSGSYTAPEATSTNVNVLSSASLLGPSIVGLVILAAL